MQGDELMDSLRVRLKKSATGRILIGADEVSEWPDGLFDDWVRRKYLVQASPANALDCQGCEEYCFMPVNVMTADGGRPAKAFIVCDKRRDVGRVSVVFSRLLQWQMNQTSFEKILNGFRLSFSGSDASKTGLKKAKAPLEFRTVLNELLSEVQTRATAHGDFFDPRDMPGRKQDFKALADKFSARLDHTQRTFDDYVQGICKFRRGARETDFYRKLFPEFF